MEYVATQERVGQGATTLETKPDNWIHRSKGMRCVTCMFYVEKVSEQGESVVGRCRKHAPTLNGWPTMYAADWCGDHKLDENKVQEEA